MHPCELPDHVVVVLLKREALLTRVRLHTARIQQIISAERLLSLQTKQLQVCGMTCLPQQCCEHLEYRTVGIVGVQSASA